MRWLVFAFLLAGCGGEPDLDVPAATPGDGSVWSGDATDASDAGSD